MEIAQRIVFSAERTHVSDPRKVGLIGRWFRALSQADFCILPFTLCSAISRRRVSLRSGGNASGLLRAAAAWVDVLCSARFVFCKPVSADRCGMAASKFLGSAAASVILLCSATGRKSY